MDALTIPIVAILVIASFFLITRFGQRGWMAAILIATGFYLYRDPTCQQIISNILDAISRAFS